MQLPLGVYDILLASDIKKSHFEWFAFIEAIYLRSIIGLVKPKIIKTGIHSFSVSYLPIKGQCDASSVCDGRMAALSPGQGNLANGNEMRNAVPTASHLKAGHFVVSFWTYQEKMQIHIKFCLATVHECLKRESISELCPFNCLHFRLMGN